MSADFSISLEAARVNAKLTQKEAAKLLGVSNTTLVNFEAGRTEPALSMIKKMSELYKIPVGYLIPTNFHVGNRSFREIDICTSANELIASITGDSIVCMKGYKAVCMPDDA